MYRRLLATMSPLSFSFVFPWIDLIRKKLFLIKAVFILVFVVVLC